MKAQVSFYLNCGPYYTSEVHSCLIAIWQTVRAALADDCTEPVWPAVDALLALRADGQVFWVCLSLEEAKGQQAAL